MNKIELASMIKSNRPDDLKEWVDYYLALGFDRITIYDNESPFSIKDLFADYKNIEVRPVKHVGLFTAYAATLYDLTSREKRGQTEWLAFFDNDEYLWLRNNNNIQDILTNNFATVCFYWKLISSQNIIENRKSTIIDSFNYAYKFIPNVNHMHVKSMINLNKCNKLFWNNVHLPIANGQKIGYTIDGDIVIEEHTKLLDEYFYERQNAILYHYFYQSYEDWLFKVEKNPDYACSRQEFEDRIIGKYDTIDNNIINKKKELGL